MAGSAIFLQGCSDGGKIDQNGCANLPAQKGSDPATADSTVVFNWRILYDTETAKTLELEDCLACVVSVGLGANNATRVVESFEACGSPKIDVDAVLALTADIDGNEYAPPITFQPPQSDNACFNNYPEKGDNADPDKWLPYCTEKPDAAATACCTCAINRLNWEFPSNSKYAGLGAGTASITNTPCEGAFCAAEAVFSGCGFSPSDPVCTYEDAKNAFEACGSADWPDVYDTDGPGFIRP